MPKWLSICDRICKVSKEMASFLQSFREISNGDELSYSCFVFILRLCAKDVNVECANIK